MIFILSAKIFIINLTVQPLVNESLKKFQFKISPKNIRLQNNSDIQEGIDIKRFSRLINLALNQLNEFHDKKDKKNILDLIFLKTR